MSPRRFRELVESLRYALMAEFVVLLEIVDSILMMYRIWKYISDA